MDRLETYRKKRDFGVTSEPAGARKPTTRKSGGGLFVMHKHDATRLHYDLRLEHGGVLWSWAVTRGPSLDPSDRRLAVHVEDHPLDYGSFEGVIPAGQYGAGAVIVWDEGRWEPDGDPVKAMKKGHIRFELKGKKLQGFWHLVRLRPRAGEKRDNWLLIKSDDAAANPGFDILEEMPKSVKSGRTIEDINEGKAAARTAKKPARKAAAKARPKKEEKKTARRAEKMPRFIEPCLATLRSTPPAGEEWVHEVKFDGYRLQAHVEGSKVKLLTRSGLDWTAKFGRQIQASLEALPCEQAIVDGEVVVLSGGGATSFASLQAALSERRPDRMTFYVFDLLHLDGADLRSEPLVERKEQLRQLVAGTEENDALRYSEHFSEPGKTMLSHVCRMGLEGVLSKRADAPYRSGRGYDWIKSKCTQRQEFVIVGYLPSQKAGRGLRSLVLAYHENGKLRPAGHVGTGFSARVLDDLKKKLDALKTDKSVFEGKPGSEKGVVWVEPKLVAEVEFRSWTSDGILRQASFQGLREDKPADEIVAEIPEDKAGAAGMGKRAKKSPAGRATAVNLTNPDKVLWPETGHTKRDMLQHYEKVWPLMQRFVVNRPLALVRAPDGIDKQRFFQKHASKGMSDSIRMTHDPQDKEEILYITDFDGVAALVQMGVVEIHLWGSTVDALDTPDHVVFDLDPDEGLDVEAVRAATLDVQSRLEELGLPTLLKTSGGKGFHVVVPMKPKANWDEVKDFAHDFARAMEQTDPDLYTATLSKKARKGRIFIDYLRNGRGSTTVAPWSTRAKPKASISVPVPWKLLDGLAPDHFTMGSKQLASAIKGADAWADYDKLRVPLKK
jgi:bifunctional non-homologous end joining protein LigD